MNTWYSDAACKGMDVRLFFPEVGNIPEEARSVCERCPVIDACREWGIRHEHFGVWGGLSEKERRRIRRERGVGCTRPEAGYERIVVPGLPREVQAGISDVTVGDVA